MNTVITRLLGAVALAPASRVTQLNGDVRRMEAKIVQLERQLELTRADTQNWKSRHGDATEAVAGWKQAMQGAQAEADQAKRGTERVRADLERAKTELEREQPRTAKWRHRAEELQTALQEMRARNETLHRAANAANEQLMGMEVKLDLIEAAIQVLDIRTREQAVSSSL